MSENLTAARPYAKAIFVLALERQELHAWADALDMLAGITLACEKYYVLKNPKFRQSQKINIFLSPAQTIAKKINFPEAENLLRLLMLQKRLLILPQIAKVYHELVAGHENVLTAKVETAIALTSSQKKKIKAKLETRLQKTIMLQEVVNSKLLGGAVIYAGDKVFDGSVLGTLQRMRANLLQ